MTTMTIELSWAGGKKQAVEAEPVGDWFAVHEMPTPDDAADQDVVGGQDRRWRATHVATGLGLPRRFLTKDGATTYAAAIAGLADWSSTDRAVLATRAKEVARAVWEAGEKAEAADLTAWCDQPLPDWPHDKPPTADHLARYHTVHAMLLSHRVGDLVDAGAFDKDTPEKLRPYLDATVAFLNTWSVAYLNTWSVAYLLRALQQHAPDAADEVAGDLWDAIESGDAPNEYSWDWLVGYRIDPAKVAAAHAEVKAKREALTRQQGGEPA